MKVSFNWLKEFIELPESPDEIAERLTMAGLEAESVTRVAAPFQGVVVADVREVTRHPNAEKLVVCRVFDGQGELQVVCGAPNVRAGAQVPFVRVGGFIGDKEIRAAELRGVASHGMICSERELGLSDEHGGILILDGGTAPGSDVAPMLGFGDSILEMGLTPNRPDCLSHVGIARELGAILDREFVVTPAVLREFGAAVETLTNVEIVDVARCPRYAARVIADVVIAPSPLAMRLRLMRLGVRAINNVVDATNFVLLERGHPLHAFDLDKLAGRRIVVRTARSGETIRTLDGASRALEADDLVIADSERAQAIAGIMGGGDSEVDRATKRILLESAYFDPRAVRKTARRLGMHTEASHRFERGADPGVVVSALDRVSGLIESLAKGTTAHGVIDRYPKAIHRPPIHLRPVRVAFVLGAAPQPDFVTRSLRRLGAEDLGDNRWEPPTYRPDLTREIDLIEEVARLWGYDNIPETLPASRPHGGACSDESAVDQLRARLVALGFIEAVNFSFTSPTTLDPFDGGRPRVRLVNPLGRDYSELRTTLFPGLLQNVAFNQAASENDLRLFELGRVFTPAAGLPMPRERTRLALVMTGRRAPDAWEKNAAPLDLQDLRGVAESLLSLLGATDVVVRPSALATFHPRASFEFDGGAGWLLRGGELHPEIAALSGLRSKVFLLEMELSRLPARARPKYSAIPRFPGVTRDVALVVDEAVPAGRAVGIARAEGGGLVEAISLFDVYRGEPISTGKKSLAYQIRYRAIDRTLTDEEVNALHARIVKKLQMECGADIRG
ncbi:MAG: phenylalanine--tRNA ligase subunit beta [Deltaproteobacteria bacterium]|nr:phenylalanine--tRNA ligase subunit beta [Deltaproteobacteria bacterium]